MKDYKRTKDGLYAYEYPRASVTADAVLFAEKDGQMHVLLIQRGNEPYKGYIVRIKESKKESYH